MSDINNDKFVNDLLNSVFKPKENLKELFERRVEELKIPVSVALEILSVESRTLNGILGGTLKRVDFTNLLKLANFLQRPKEQVVQLYIESLEKNFPDVATISPEKVEFIKNNFDLASLKKVGFIDSISDFEQIEKRIVTFFGLRDIREYQRPPVEVAFSAAAVQPKNDLTRSFWIKTASDVFEERNNPYEFNRDALVKYFPQIRWHSTNVELGLKSVIRDLFKIGITVTYVPPFPSLHLRGATFSVNDKPCIVLTDLVGFYPTLWFALVHELFHVLFDWEEIKNHSYHISDDENEQLSVREREKEADNFAREYLFSKEKLDKIRPFINNSDYVKEFALNNHVHPSFIYVFNAREFGKYDRMAWARAKKQTPKVEDCIYFLDNPWNSPTPIPDYVKSTHKAYN